MIVDVNHAPGDHFSTPGELILGYMLHCEEKYVNTDADADTDADFDTGLAVSGATPLFHH